MISTLCLLKSVNFPWSYINFTQCKSLKSDGKLFDWSFAFIFEKIKIHGLYTYSSALDSCCSNFMKKCTFFSLKNSLGKVLLIIIILKINHCRLNHLKSILFLIFFLLVYMSGCFNENFAMVCIEHAQRWRITWQTKSWHTWTDHNIHQSRHHHQRQIGQVKGG